MKDKRMPKTRWLFLLLVLVATALYWLQASDAGLSRSAEQWQPPVSAAPAVTAKTRVPCANHKPLRQAFFGDLHVHTAYSMDARSRGMLGTADDAYRFAQGEPVSLGPYDQNQVGTRAAQLKRPLDFAAVTDHAEWIGEISLCTRPESPAYHDPGCQAYRGEIESSSPLAKLLGENGRMTELMGLWGRHSICGKDNALCRAELVTAWKDTQQAAERYYDRTSDCSFTSFHAYEYSNSSAFSKVHRNIIFRNEVVPELPISSLEQPDPRQLWQQLDRLCTDSGGACDALSIPHNPNVSNGRMFTIPWREENTAEQQRQARLRARWEPVVEIMQIKGESECKAGLWQVYGNDELCDFEKMREPAIAACEGETGSGAIFGRGCQSRLDFARYALIEGMAEQQRIGVNPYRFGFAGSTDSHNATPGDVDEENYDGCCANTDNSIPDRMRAGKGFAGRPAANLNPGGLVGIWAEENSRDSLFDGLRRREVFATSGPRIAPRFFAGWELPGNVCEGNFAASGYEGGVAMGGELPITQAKSPVFAAAARADPDGNPLQRLQIIKVWQGQGDAFHQAIFDISGNKDNGAGVDLGSCETRGPGAMQLCATWSDPQFDPTQSAAYYLRVIENPSCRWSWRQCLQLPAAERPAACDDPALPRSIQERAWSSPIWLTPEKG
jgi:hypothetical protein